MDVDLGLVASFDRYFYRLKMDECNGGTARAKPKIRLGLETAATVHTTVGTARCDIGVRL